MAGINIDRATRTLTDSAFIISAALVVVGSLLAQVTTEFMRANVYNVQVQGGDAIYAVVAAFLALVVLPGQYGRPIALGSGATAVRTALDQFGVV